MHIITDNWLVKDAALAISGRMNPRKPARLVSVVDGRFQETPTTRGALCVLSLVALLEQVVLCDEIGVMQRYTSTWRRHGTFDGLLSSNVIVPLTRQPPHSAKGARYLSELLEHQGVREEYDRHPESWYSQIITTGVADYLALADEKERPYCPHPIRQRFLADTLWYRAWPTRAVNTLHRVVDSPRMRLYASSGGNTALASLTCMLPAVAILCLREASNQTSPISVALQLREETALKRLRLELSELEASLRIETPSQLVSCVMALEAAAAEVERSLHLRVTNDASSPRTIAVYGLPLAVPKALQRPVVRPKHTGIMSRLVATSTLDLDEILGRSIGLRDRAVINSLRDVAPLVAAG